METYLEKILFVDDDQNLLDSYKRQLRKQFRITTAPGGQAGLQAFKEQGAFAVVVADMRMPEMDGVTFLSHVKEQWPHTIRMMLTGNADMQTAVDAVNQGNIFRFMNKPCPPEMIVNALIAAVEQWRLVNAERELLEKTLRGSVTVLTEILSMINPSVFSRANRIKQYALHMARQLKLPDVWKFDLAALLSQIGCVTVPQEILTKVYSRRELKESEEKIYQSHPTVARKLLENIPRLEQVARMVEGQLKPVTDYAELAQSSKPEDKLVMLGSQILKIASDYERLIARAISHQAALTYLGKQPEIYNVKLLQALENMESESVETESRDVMIDDLDVGMVAEVNIKAKSGLLILPAGNEITFPVLEILRNFAAGGQGIDQPIRVRVPIVAESAFGL